MSDYEHKANEGTLFKNDYKTSDKHPLYKGSFNDHCSKCHAEELKDMAIWFREPDGKKKYFFVKTSPKRESPAASSAASDADPFS